MLAGFAAVRANVHHDMGAHHPSALIKTGDESGHQTSTRKLMPPIMLLVTEVEISLLFVFLLFCTTIHLAYPERLAALVHKYLVTNPFLSENTRTV